MNSETTTRFPQVTSKKVIIVSLICFILLMLSITAQLTYSVLNYNKIYDGVYVNGIDAGGFTKEDFTELLKERYENRRETVEITLNSSGKNVKFKLTDIGTTYGISDAVDMAFNIGREGNPFDRLLEIYKSSRKKNMLPLSFSYDKKKLEDIVQSLYDKTFISVKEPDLMIQSDKVIVRSGHHGEAMDKDQALKDIQNLINDCSSGIIDVPAKITASNKINVDDFFNQISRDVKDAYPSVENNSIKIVPEVIGRKLDKSVLASIASELEKTEDTEKVLPVAFVQPSVTAGDVSKQLFKDTLGTMYTQFYTYNTNDANRGENIRLAVSKINGKIIGPGEVFSFNDVVGPRTEDQGYKVAHVYANGDVVDDVGGGICQVSTTLYNSVLYSDLEVLERTNHMFTVAYVPLGRDAAVSYGDVDLKFKNPLNWPIKLEGWVTGDNRLFFAIKGTNESPGKTIEINSNIVKTNNFTTKYIDDPTLPQGESIVTKDGITGYVVDAYKIVRKDGNVINESKLHTSIYNPLQREVRRGTKKQ